MAAAAIKDIIAIGGSAGSSSALKALLCTLPGDIPASVFVSTHIPAHAPSLLANVLSVHSSLPVSQARDGQAIKPGHVYIAAPDRHLLLIDNKIRLGVGPRENMARPSIDPMFRSAAFTYGSRTIGVVLSGMLNDGAAGLHAIRARGGTAIVQHPIDAEADQMPLAALETVDVDHVVSAADLGKLLGTLAGSPAGASTAIGDNLRLEVDIALGGHSGSDTLARFATPSPLSCPDCDGVLSEVNDAKPLRYRCQVGHAYTAEHLAAQMHQVDEAIRVAMRIMEERVTLVNRMALDAHQTGRSAVAELYEARGKEYGRYAMTLRDAAIATFRSGNPSQNEDI